MCTSREHVSTVVSSATFVDTAHTHINNALLIVSQSLTNTAQRDLHHQHRLVYPHLPYLLLQVSHDAEFEAFCCDAVKLPLRSGAFDATICIAVLHHLASVGARTRSLIYSYPNCGDPTFTTLPLLSFPLSLSLCLSPSDRRSAVIRELLRITRPGGFVLIHAWAKEQGEDSKHYFPDSVRPIAAAICVLLSCCVPLLQLICIVSAVVSPCSRYILPHITVTTPSLSA